jgi:hypothetical protein
MMISVLVALAAVMFLAPGLAFASSEDFETYTNQNYGFSIDYPSNWLAKEDQLQPNQIVIFHPDPEEFEELPSPATVSVWNLLWADKTLNITEVDNEYGTKDIVSTRLVSKNLTTLSGLPAIENTYYQYTETDNFKAREIFAIADNEIFFVFYNTHPGYFDEYLPIVNQMVESFKVG